MQPRAQVCARSCSTLKHGSAEAEPFVLPAASVVGRLRLGVPQLNRPGSFTRSRIAR